MDNKKIIRSIVFFAVGLVLLWLVFRGTDLGAITQELHRISWFWVGASVLLNVLSQFVRALRWQMLFAPIPYNPRTSNLFMAILTLAFVNQIIPRGGEIAHLGVLNRYEKIPFTKLFGTLLVERLTDLGILLLLFIVLLAWQFPNLMRIIELPEISMQNVDYTRALLIGAGGVVVLGLSFLLMRRFRFYRKVRQKAAKIKAEIREGFATIYKIDRKAWYFFLSVLIYGIWLLMLYVLIFAYPPTTGLTFKSAAFTFGLATSAFLLPIQSGMGAWHFLVIESLLLFGIGAESGKAFAIMAHAATNLVYLPLGAMAFALLPLINRKPRKRPIQQA